MVAYPTETAPGPAVQGLIFEDFDSVAAATNTAPAVGVIFLHRVILANTETITNIVCSLNGGGNTLTANQNFAAIYDANGVRQAVTTDATTAWGTAGAKILPLTAAVTLPAGTYYIALLANGLGAPTFHSAFGGTVVNAGQAAAPFRFGSSGAAQTAMPANITLSGMAAVNGPIWVGGS